MLLCALRDRSINELIEFFPSEEKAQETLAEILADEPQWRDVLDVKVVEFMVSPN